MSLIVQTAEGEENKETHYNLETAKSSFSICYSYSCEVKSLKIYQNRCPTGRGVLNSFQARYWALSHTGLEKLLWATDSCQPASAEELPALHQF